MKTDYFLITHDEYAAIRKALRQVSRRTKRIKIREKVKKENKKKRNRVYKIGDFVRYKGKKCKVLNRINGKYQVCCGMPPRIFSLIKVENLEKIK